MKVAVTETFFSLPVADIERATAFYVEAFGAEVLFASEGWTSLLVARVRLGLGLVPREAAGTAPGARVGIHFAVDDLEEARAAVLAAGGQAAPAIEIAPGVHAADATDTEGNSFTLNAR